MIEELKAEKQVNDSKEEIKDCSGSYILGTACIKCTRCSNERSQLRGDFGTSFNSDGDAFSDLPSEYQHKDFYANVGKGIAKDVDNRKDSENEDNCCGGLYCGSKSGSDKVNHPNQYNSGKYEVIEIIKDAGLALDFCLGNSLKYILRAKHKENFTEDIKKAQWYLNYIIENSL